MRDDLLEWAENHGYRHYRCNVCHWSGWTDGDPRGECYCPPDEDDEDECDEPEKQT